VHNYIIIFNNRTLIMTTEFVINLFVCLFVCFGIVLVLKTIFQTERKESRIIINVSPTIPTHICQLSNLSGQVTSFSVLYLVHQLLQLQEWCLSLDLVIVQKDMI